MARHKSRAYVLDAADYRETSKLIHLLCENEGRISVIGKGLRSPRNRKSQAVDTFNLVQVGYTLKEGATLGLLGSIDAEEVYGGLRANLPAYALASFWFEVLKVVGQARMASPELFALTGAFLRHVQGSSTLSSQTVSFMVRLTAALGFGIELGECRKCGTREGLHRIDLTTGSVTCASCPAPRSRTIQYPGSLQKIMPALENGSIVELSPGDSLVFLAILQEYLSLHLDHRFRTFSFLKQVLDPSTLPQTLDPSP